MQRYRPAVAPAVGVTALIDRHRGLVDRAARTIAARTGVDVDDLWSVGTLALVDAAARFDDSLGVRIETFLAHRVRGAMLDEVRRLDRLPRRMRARVGRVARAREALQRRLGREPSEAEIATEANLDEKTVREAVRAAAASQPAAVEGGAGDDVHGSADLDEPTLEDLAVAAEQQELLAEAIAALPERLQLIVSLRYVEDLTLKEIAGMLQVSEPRVCQLLRSAIQQLRQRLQA